MLGLVEAGGDTRLVGLAAIGRAQDDGEGESRSRKRKEIHNKKDAYGNGRKD